MQQGSLTLVIQTRSVEYMPFYLSLSTFLMNVSFFAYGIFNKDPFIYCPNGIGVILGIVQLALYSYYKNKSVEDYSCACNFLKKKKKLLDLPSRRSVHLIFFPFLSPLLLALSL
ncbi:Bidirectional sugar transporter sweet2 [Ancistrocladus abbreviatus]